MTFFSNEADFLAIINGRGKYIVFYLLLYFPMPSENTAVLLSEVINFS